MNTKILFQVHCLVTALLLLPQKTSAQLGTEELGRVNLPAGGGSEGIRSAVLSILFDVLSFVGLIAVVMIVIAGIYLVVGGGDDGTRDKAKKMIIYVLVGIIVMLLSSALVYFLARLF